MLCTTRVTHRNEGKLWPGRNFLQPKLKKHGKKLKLFGLMIEWKILGAFRPFDYNQSKKLFHFERKSELKIGHLLELETNLYYGSCAHQMQNQNTEVFLEQHVQNRIWF